MSQLKKSDWFCYSALVLVILFSFFSFSYAYYPFFNSDSALSVLMAYDYHLPEDLYCWGQNRGGTFEMMIAHFFISVFHSSPLITSSVIHYLILVAGMLAAFHFIKQSFYRLVLAVVWFFPSRFFIEIILYQFSIQFSLFMIAIFFFSKALSSQGKKSLFLSLSFLFMILNVWVLDLGFIPVVFLSMLLIAAFLLKKKKPELVPERFYEFFTRKNIFISLLWVAAGICFISYAKHISAYSIGYAETELNSFNGIYTSIALVFNSIANNFLFNRRYIPESIYFYSVLVFFFVLVVHSIKQRGNYFEANFFRSFFLWQSVFGCVILMLLKQVLINDVPVRYFAGSYLSFSIFILMKLDSSEIKKPLIKIFLFIVLIGSVISSLHENYKPKKLTPMMENFALLNTIKPVGIIGSYWNSYVFSAIDPAHIKATPHDLDLVRNRKLADEVLEQPTILLIQNDWLKIFPDSIPQFGTMLVKKGNPFLLGTFIVWEEVYDVSACEYSKAQ